MEIQTSTFGTLSINPEDVINFPEGLIGFPSNVKFKLFHEEKESPTVYWLQSLDTPDFSLSVVMPSSYNVEYEIPLSDEQQALIQITDPADALILLIIYKESDAEKEHSTREIKAAVKSPLVINTKTQLGLQLSLNSLTIRE